MKSLFLSHFLTEQTPGYGGSVGVKIQKVTSISEGASSNSQQWILSNHIGTHIDLPSHFDDSGKRLEDFQSSEWIFKQPFLLSIAAEPGDILNVDDRFQDIPLEVDFLIIKTGFQKHRGQELYWKKNPGLSPELATWLRSERPHIKCLGFDFISITSYADRPLGRLAHKAFLANDSKTEPLRVIEDMKLDELNCTPNMIIVAPLLVQAADGAPVTVMALI